MTFGQTQFEIRCEWGVRGLRELAPVSEVVIVVDVLSFTTALDIGTARGGVIFPYPFREEGAAEYAACLGADLASTRRGAGLSLSPASLERMEAGRRLVLPSPHGAALAFSAAHEHVMGACLRNAAAIAAAAGSAARVAVIPAGETWDTGELRPCLEDLAGAGAVIASLRGRRSPEAELAAAVFDRLQGNLPTVLRQCGSGQELIERGFAADVELAAALNVSRNVPCLRGRAFTGIPAAEV